jgi:hypothetical protein
VAGRSRIAPEALLHHATSATPRPAAKRARPALIPTPGGSDLGAPLPLGSLPLGTYVTNQFQKDGIVFSGQAPFITDDGSSSVNPTISGSPLFQGTVVGTFVKPGTNTPATVNDFALSVGYIDSPGSTQMTVYDSKGNQLGVLVATQSGFNELFSTFPNAASFSVSSVANEPAGWEINTIQIGAINTTYIAMGDSYSSGEGTYDFPWSQSQGTQCDTGPEAWPVQMADAQNSNSTGATLTIGPDTLVACQGERSYQLNEAVNGESTSEIGQLSNYVTNNGPPDLVSLTIGGNDLGFADILKNCFLGGTEVCLHVVDSLDNKVTTGADSLISTLASTYSSIQSAAGQDAQVVVAGYPNLFPQPGGFGRAISVTYHCPWLRESTFPFFGLPISPLLNTLLGRISDAQAALNDDMAVAAAEAGVEFAPIPFSLQGHELCTGTPYINPLGLIKGITGDRNIGHPNVAGQAAVANAVGSQLGLGTNGGPRGGAGPRVGATRPAGHPRAVGPRHRGRNVADSGTLSFSGGPLADGTVGASYIDYLVSTGGTGADTWSVTSGSLPPGLSLDPNAGTITGTPTTSGSYTFTAQVTDSSVPTPQTVSASVSINVNAASTLSVATTQASDGTAGQPYQLSLAATGGLGAVSWKITSGALPAGLHLNAAAGLVTGTPGAAAVGTAAFTVQATDSSSPAQVATASESITVHPASDPLTVTATSLPEIPAGQDYAAQLTSTGGVAPVAWSVTSGSLPPGLSLDAATGVLSGTPTASGTFSFTAQVADATAPASQTASAPLSIIIDPAAPLAISTTSLFDGTENSYYSSTLQAQGGAGSYQWYVTSGSLPAGLSLDAATGQITGIPTGTGTSAFDVTVYDAAGNSAAASYQVTIAVSPLTVSQSLPKATVSAYYTADITPSGGAAPYGWSLISGSLPSGLSFDSSTGAIVGTPTQSGSFPLSVLVTDSSSPSQQATANVTLTVVADPPLKISSHTPVRGAVGTPYTIGIGYSGGQAPYSWAITAGTLPPGLSIDPGSGMITGTPTTAGSYPVTIQVTDSSSPTPQVASASVTFTIENALKLAVTSTALPLATQGTSYAATLQASGGIAPYTWSLYSGSLPAGLSLGSDGVISGTPTGHGTSGFTVQVTDSNSTSATARLHFSFLVNKAAPLAITTTGALDTASQGSSYFEQLGADGGVAPYTWTLGSGKLPAGLQLDPSGFISGTPTHFGTSTFTVDVTDSATPTAGLTKQVLSLTVEAIPPAPPSFTADSPYSPVALNTSYSYQFQASGSPAPKFYVTSGSLPKGLKLARSGVLSGTTAHAGTYTFQVTATNGRAPDAVSPQLSITVVPPPVITGFTPAEAVPGTKVVISGKNLENASYVYFTGSYATITSDTAYRIVTYVPEYASSGPIYIGTPGGSTVSSTSFTVDPAPPPVITSISPTSAAAGTVLTITGTGLEFAYQVQFNGAYSYSFTRDTATELKVYIPGGISAGPVTVYTDGGSATSSQTFTPTG